MMDELKQSIAILILREEEMTLYHIYIYIYEAWLIYNIIYIYIYVLIVLCTDRKYKLKGPPNHISTLKDLIGRRSEDHSDVGTHRLAEICTCQQWQETVGMEGQPLLFTCRAITPNKNNMSLSAVKKKNSMSHEWFLPGF